MADRILTRGLKTGTGVGGVKFMLLRGLTSSVAVIPDYIFRYNPISGHLDKVVNDLSVLKSEFLDESIPFVLSNEILEDVLFQYDNVNDRLKIKNIVIDKASGSGIRVDRSEPTFGFADILGDQFSKNTGATKPVLTVYNGVINAWRFSASDEAFVSYHIPHDYVAGSDLFLHIHWSQISTTNTGGTLDFKYTAIYSKGHAQAAFNGTPIVKTFTSADAGSTRYLQHITEIQLSATSPVAGEQFDSDDLEPDGVIELTFEVDINNLTDSVTVTDPFVHFIDLHYQTTGVIGTKGKVPTTNCQG